ncbi:Extracellular membrane protein, CFEM domain [Phaffia rhodozyma]|uniref:Extracellular membrane protein, CFEM domain n=1 Tax=Phaffia rhodozyma TaxID=264483 RepID=A0A0F7SM79_PHARH|nr:Extracellular membrane protein, CFEM domain [Phaffia rhodozyma]
MSPLPISVVLPHSLFAKRQEACALSCLTTVSAGSCTAQDASCLCPSSSWGTEILSCVQATCETEDVLHLAYEELLAYCLLSDVTFTLPEPSFTRSSAGLATASASITASASVAVSATVAASSSAVVVPTAITSSTSTADGNVVAASGSSIIHPEPVNVSGIMAGVCSLFFAIALVFGYFGVREKLRHDKQHGGSRSRDNWPRGPVSTDKEERRSPGSSGNRTASSDDQSQRSEQPEMSSTGGVSTSAFSLEPEESCSDLDLEIEERRAKLRRVRLERAEAADLIRRENLLHIFTSAPSLDNASPTSTTSSASVASPDAYRFSVDQSVDDKKFSLGFTALDEKEEDEEEDQYRLQLQGRGEDDAEAQYVDMPSARDSTVLDPFTPTSVQSTEAEDGIEDGPRTSGESPWLVDRPLPTLNRQR